MALDILAYLFFPICGAQAQFALADIAKKLKAMGKNVRFGIQ